MLGSMNTLPIVPVILSGGFGTRLWPMSSAAHPKQFLPLVGGVSMFRQTLARVADRAMFAAPLIVCGAEHVAHVEADLSAEGISDARVIVEPAARNTAPAIALAAHAAGADATPMLVMPSDHVMTMPAAFVEAVQRALPAVGAGALATFGITPTAPETGYGYIAVGAAPDAAEAGVRQVLRFVEKPDLANAKAMLDSGDHLWNAGIFLMRADRYLGELARHVPNIGSASAAAMAQARMDGACLHPDATAFAASPKDSIDYAVMERADNVVVIAVDAGWSDVGSWSALYDLWPHDAARNASDGAIRTIDSSGNLIRAGEGKRISLLGVENLIVVADGDDILIIPRDRAQDVKRLIEGG